MAARFHNPGHHSEAMKAAVIDEAFAKDVDEAVAEKD